MEPKILLLETSGKNCSVAIAKGNEMIGLCEEKSENFSHSKKLHTFVQWALEGAELSLQDLNAIAISEGPGSYTGLRIGASAAKGFAYTLQIPLISTQTLRALVQPFFTKKYDRYVGTIDAKRGEIYYQIFENSSTHSQAQNIIVDQNFLNNFSEYKTLFVGSGVLTIQNIIKEYNLDQSNFSFNELTSISAKNAIPQAVSKFQKKEFEDVAYFEPMYVKPVHITPPKKKL